MGVILTTGDMISRVRVTAGDEAKVLYTDQTIVDWLNDAQRECCVDNLLLQVTATQTTIVGQSGYALPQDILKLHSIKYDNSKLRVVTQEEFDELYESTGSEQGTPFLANTWANTLTLFPAPDSAKQLQILYIRTPVALSAASLSVASELPASYHRRLVDYALAMVAEQDDDMNRYQIKMDEFRTGVQSIKSQAESTEDLYPFISTDMRDMGEGAYYGEY